MKTVVQIQYLITKVHQIQTMMESMITMIIVQISQKPIMEFLTLMVVLMTIS